MLEYTTRLLIIVTLVELTLKRHRNLSGLIKKIRIPFFFIKQKEASIICNENEWGIRLPKGEKLSVNF